MKIDMDWIRIIFSIIFSVATCVIAFIIIPIMNKKKKDVPIWLILLAYLFVSIAFIIDIIFICSVLH